MRIRLAVLAIVAALAALMIGGTLARAQIVNVRWDLPVYTVQAQGGNLLPVYAIPGALVSFYSEPAGTLASTYNTATATTPCPSGSQVVLNGSAACVTTADAYGNMGSWFQPGQYMATITARGTSYNYYFTIANSGQSGVSSVGIALPTSVFANGSPVTGSGNVSATFISQSANQFFAGPCSAGGTPAFRFICTADSVAALAADSTFTWNVATLNATNVNSTTIHNSGQLISQSIYSNSTLAYHTDCSTIGNVSFALNYVSNGAVSGPVSASVTSAGVCPLSSAYTLGPWVTNNLAVAEGGGINFSNCGSVAFCATGTGANQLLQTTTTVPTGACPGATAGTNDPVWNLSQDGHVAFCSNQTGSTWVTKI